MLITDLWIQCRWPGTPVPPWAPSPSCCSPPSSSPRAGRWTSQREELHKQKYNMHYLTMSISSNMGQEHWVEAVYIIYICLQKSFCFFFRWLKLYLLGRPHMSILRKTYCFFIFNYQLSSIYIPYLQDIDRK